MVERETKMRRGILSDQTIRSEYAAFFVADDGTHKRTLSQHHEHVKGNHRPQRARKPRFPFYTLYDTARYVDRVNPYETAHEMVVNYTATVTPQQHSMGGPSTPMKTPSTHSSKATSPVTLTRFAESFNARYPDLADAPLDTETRAFLRLARIDPLRVLEIRTLGRFGGGGRMFLRNSLEAVEQRALDFTQRKPEEYAQVVQAIGVVSAAVDEVKEEDDE
jgi:hypothetical protein